MGRLKFLLASGFFVSLTACPSSDSYCTPPAFESVEVDITRLEGENDRVVISWAPDEELEDEFFLEHMVPREVEGVEIEVTGDRTIIMEFDGPATTETFTFELQGCDFGDRYEIDLTLDFDPVFDATFVTRLTHLGSCNLISPAPSRGWSTLATVAVFGLITLFLGRRSRRSTDA